MAFDLSQLEKLYILSYSDPGYNTVTGPPFFALINPETYSYKYKIEFCESQAPGTSGVALKFNKMPPQEFNFDFLFDGTGVINADIIPVTDQLDIFRNKILQYQGEIHRPYYLKIHWGTLLFKGVLTAMDIEFKLFRPDGSPLRAVARCSFKGTIEENLRVAMENAMSPDITHERISGASDKLPLMTKKIYNDKKYYIDIANYNQLDGFRNIASGTKLFFPPTD
jgi:Contractile injection system tube protein